MEDNKDAVKTNAEKESAREDENPQEGDKWSNYRTKELAGDDKGAESAEEAAKVFEKEQ